MDGNLWYNHGTGPWQNHGTKDDCTFLWYNHGSSMVPMTFNMDGNLWYNHGTMTLLVLAHKNVNLLHHFIVPCYVLFFGNYDS